MHLLDLESDTSKKTFKCHHTRRARFPGAGEPETPARQKILAQFILPRNKRAKD
jgi:hypothetical protein